MKGPQSEGVRAKKYLGQHFLHDGAVARRIAHAAPAGRAIEQVGLIVPASLCAGEVAKLIAARLNREGLGRDRGLSRFVALPHTEGCGVSGGGSEDLLLRLLLGHLQHPAVAFGHRVGEGARRSSSRAIRLVSHHTSAPSCSTGVRR